MDNKRAMGVYPLKTIDIRQKAMNLRKMLRITTPQVDIIRIFETLVGFEFFEFQVETKEDMPHEYGFYEPVSNTIHIRDDVYEKALSGDGFGRSTIAHEVGHWYLGHGQTGYARQAHTYQLKTIEDPEWQANKFAQELLIDINHLEPYTSPKAIQVKFGVTFEMAEVAYAALRREGITQ